MRERIRLSFTVVVLFLLLMTIASRPLATANSPAPTYTIIDLGDLGGFPFSRAHSINAQGQVVGESNSGLPAPGKPAFLWGADTGMQNLGPLVGFDSVAYGINDRGQVVGSRRTTAGAT